MIQSNTGGIPAYMNVMPAGNGYGGDGFGMGGFGGGWWMLMYFVLFAMMGGGFGGWGNNGANNDAMLAYALMNQGNNNNTNSDIQRGFDQQAVIGGINGVAANVNGLGAQVCNGFAQAEIAANGRQMADMQMQYQGQMNTMQQFFDMMRGFDSCCCDNKLATADLKATVLQENCADRNALSEAMMQLYMSNTSNTQRLIDTMNQIGTNLNNKLCQLEMDGKNDKIADLQRQLSESNLANVVRQACGNPCSSCC
jgi:hypothetical protein